MILKIDIIIIIIVRELNSMLKKEKVWTCCCLGILRLATSAALAPESHLSQVIIESFLPRSYILYGNFKMMGSSTLPGSLAALSCSTDNNMAVRSTIQAESRIGQEPITWSDYFFVNRVKC